MSKQQLRFVIDGKTVAYTGYAENRAKDLMQALVRLSVAEDNVLANFRANIPEEVGISDAEVIKRFEDVQRRHREKEERRNGQDRAEGSQQITITYKGRTYSCTGQPSKKSRAVIELLIKQSDLDRPGAIAAYRENIPDTPLTDDQIWEQVEDATALRTARQQRKKDSASNHPQPSSSRSDGARTASPQTANVTPMASARSGIDAINELGEYTQEERESINHFISKVISDSNLTGFSDSSISSDYQPMTGGPRGKLRIDCYEEGTNVTKVILVSPDMTFADFYGVVEKKFGRKMALSFYEGSDEIEVDDDDVLEMFLKMPLVDGRRRLICSNPEKRRKETDDKMTGVTGVTTSRPKAFSNGKLEVKEERTFTGHSLPVYSCAFGPRGDRFCTASRDRSVRVWNTKTGSNTVMSGGHNSFALTCDFSAKGDRIVSGSDDRTIKVWSVSKGTKVVTLRGHEDKVYCVQYNKSGDYIVSSSCDTTVRVWNASTGQKQAVMRGHTLAVFSCSFSNTDNGKYVVSGSDDRLIKVWDWAASKEVRTLMGHTGTVWSCCFAHNDKHIASSSMDYEVRLWDTESGSCIRTMNGHQASIHHVTFSTNDKYILSCARDWTVMVWDRETGEHMETIQGHSSAVYHMAIFNDKLLTCSLDTTVKLFTIREKSLAA